MGSIGTGELVIVLIIVLLIFGGSQLPKLARSLGQAQKEFKQGVNDGTTAEDTDKKL
jgi:sec-independent protein translocase protein TatA